MEKEPNHHVDNIDYDSLPKWVIGGIDPVTGLLGFGKTYDVDEHGVITNWRIELFHTQEDAQKARDACDNYPPPHGYDVVNLDELCLELIKRHTAP